MPKFTIWSTDKAALQEYNLKSALYQTMHANKSFNKNHATHRLYHALIEALIEDENAIDKGVADTTKRRKTKDSKSSKKPSTTKETYKGKAPSKGSKTGKSALAKELVEEPIAEMVMDDAGDNVVRNDDQPQDASNPKTVKTPNPYWFKQPLRPPTPDPEWNKHQDPLTFNDLMATPIDLSKYVLNRLKIDNLTQDILVGPAYNLLKGTCSSSVELEYHFQECFNALTNSFDWNNPKGDRYPFDLSKHLPLQGHLGHLTIATNYFFNNYLEYLKSSDLERTYTTSITKTKATRYETEGIKDMVPTLWSLTKVGSQLNKFSKHNVYSTQKILGVKSVSVSVKKLYGYGHLEEIVVKIADHQLYKFKEGDFVDLHLNDIEDMLLLATIPEIEFKELYTPSHKRPGVIYEDLTKQKRVMRADELYKFSDGTLKKVRDELHHREMRERRIIRNLEILVGARELEMDYKPMTQHQSDTKVFTMTMESLPEPTSNKLCDALIMRTASAATKPYQGDSSEFYLITGNIYTD
ncbi:hypothetical protein Tco_0571791 [Tanacetum coccineum]